MNGQFFDRCHQHKNNKIKKIKYILNKLFQKKPNTPISNNNSSGSNNNATGSIGNKSSSGNDTEHEETDGEKKKKGLCFLLFILIAVFMCPHISNT